MTGVNNETVCINQDGSESPASILRATLSPTSRRHCNDIQIAGTEGPKEKEQHSETDFGGGRNNTGNAYVLDEIVRHIGSRLRLRYLVRWYRCRKEDDPAKPSTIYLSISLTSADNNSVSGERGYNDWSFDQTTSNVPRLPDAPLQSTALKELARWRVLRNGSQRR